MLPTAPKPLQEEERIEALRSFEILDTDPDAAFDDLLTVVLIIIIITRRRRFRRCWIRRSRFRVRRSVLRHLDTIFAYLVNNGSSRRLIPIRHSNSVLTGKVTGGNLLLAHGDNNRPNRFAFWHHKDNSRLGNRCPKLTWEFLPKVRNKG